MEKGDVKRQSFIKLAMTSVDFVHMDYFILVSVIYIFMNLISHRYTIQPEKEHAWNKLNHSKSVW